MKKLPNDLARRNGLDFSKGTCVGTMPENTRDVPLKNNAHLENFNQ